MSVFLAEVYIKEFGIDVVNNSVEPIWFSCQPSANCIAKPLEENGATAILFRCQDDGLKAVLVDMGTKFYVSDAILSKFCSVANLLILKQQHVHFILGINDLSLKRRGQNSLTVCSMSFQ